MPLRPFTYIPDELFDLGGAGEHEIEFTAWIKSEVGVFGSTTTVQITRAVVHVVYGEIKQELDVTARINRDHYARDMWEAEILASYEGARDDIEYDREPA